MKVCPKCGKEFEDDVNFCRQCGEELVIRDEKPAEKEKLEMAETKKATPEPEEEKSEKPEMGDVKSIKAPEPQKGLRAPLPPMGAEPDVAKEPVKQQSPIPEVTEVIHRFDSKLSEIAQLRKDIKKIGQFERFESEEIAGIKNKMALFDSKLKRMGSLEREVKHLEEKEAEEEKKLTSIAGKLRSVTLLKKEIKDIEEDVEDENKKISGMGARISRNVLNKIRRGLFMKEGGKQSKTILSLREGIKKLVSEMEDEELKKIRKKLIFTMEDRIQKQNEEIENLREELRNGIKSIQSAISKQTAQKGPKGLDSKIKELEDRIQEMKSFETAFEQQLKNLNIEALSGEIQALKQKMQTDTADVRSLQTRIEELERKIDSVRMAAPVIIE
jgi:DNA repair exonuclease SbcCD ATPase subunit